MKTMFKFWVLFFALAVSQANETYGIKESDEFIFTVNGKTSIENLNFSLTHEHIMSNFGAPPSYLPEYNSALLFSQVIPYLKKIKSLGVSSIFECTTAYFGRDVQLLKALADSTGVQIITNTGFYGAYNDYYVPESAFDLSAEEIAQLWIDEFEQGIDQTGIKPGFIKLGFDDGTPTEIDKKLFKAGILAHLSTGMTIVVHTGNNPGAAAEQLRLLEENKVSPSAWVWVHANKVTNQDLLFEAARKGAWISLDGITESNTAEYVKKIDSFKAQNLLGKILLSHDGNSFPRGGAIRKYEALSSILIPELEKQGYSSDEIDQLTIKNPQEAFRIRVRSTEPQTSIYEIHRASESRLYSAYFSDGQLIIQNKIIQTPVFYRVYTLSGQVVRSGSFQSDIQGINTSQFSKGAYLIQVVNTEGITRTIKVVH